MLLMRAMLISLSVACALRFADAARCPGLSRKRIVVEYAYGVTTHV